MGMGKVLLNETLDHYLSKHTYQFDCETYNDGYSVSDISQMENVLDFSFISREQTEFKFMK